MRKYSNCPSSDFNNEAFEQEHDKLRIMFTNLCCPSHLTESTICKFNQIVTRETSCQTNLSDYIKLMFKSQQSVEKRAQRNGVTTNKNWCQTPTRIH